MKTVTQLSVLFLEDSERDAEIVYHRLADDFECPVHMDTADTEPRFLRLIGSKKYDLILADYTLPGYTAPAALAQALAICPETPFICVSGTIGEDNAVEMLKQGATDYVLKDRLGRLSFAVARALDVAWEKEEQRKEEQKKDNYKRNLEEAQSIAHIGNWELDIQENKVTVSAEIYRIMGLDPNTSVLYPGIEDNYLSEENKRRISEVIDAVVRENKPYDIEVALCRPDGKTVFVNCRASTKHDADGKPVLVVGTMQDITERKLAEEEAKRHAEFENTIRNLAQDFINMPSDKFDEAITSAIGLVGEYCRIERASIWQYDWNEETMSRLYEWDKVPGKFLNKRWHVIPFKTISEAIECHKLGKPFHIVNTTDLPYNYPHRQALDMAGVKSISLFPLMADGKAIGTFIYSSINEYKEWDVQESLTVELFCQMLANVLLHREQDDALRQLNESYRHILNSTNDDIAMFGIDGTILNIKKGFAEAFGSTVEEAIGQKYEAFFPDEEVFKLRLAKIRNVAESGRPECFKDSRCGFWFSSRLYPVFTDNRVTAVTLFATDITEQKNAEEEAAKRAEYQARLKVITDFFTNISHEFKTPLTIILNSIEMTEMKFRNVEFENKERAFKNLAVMR